MKKKVFHGGQGGRFPAARLVLCVILVAAATLGLATPARADGIMTHQEIAERALARIQNPELRQLLRDHWDAVDSGAAFPDWGYTKALTDWGRWDYYRNLAEYAHNTEFQTAFIEYLEEAGTFQRSWTETDHMTIAFLLGMISHKTADDAFHAPGGVLDMAREQDHLVWLEATAHPLYEDKVDTIVGVLSGENLDSVDWYFPVDALSYAYGHMKPESHPVGQQTLSEGTQTHATASDVLKGKSFAVIPGVLQDAARVKLAGPPEKISWINSPVRIPLHWTWYNLQTWPIGGLENSADLTVRAWRKAWLELTRPQVARVTISGPTKGPRGVYTFTAAFEPADARPPADWAWDNGDTTLTTTRELTELGTYRLNVTAKARNGTALAAESLTFTVRDWEGTVKQNLSGSTPTLRVESAIAVVVTGRPGLVVDIHSGGWTATCTTGNKPEYGPNACEFGGLRASTYTITPRGWGESVQVTVDGVGWALVQFDPVLAVPLRE